jgi:hypothetical protein
MVVVVAVAVAAPPEPARGDKKPKGAPAPFPPLAVAVFKGEVIGCALPALAVTDSPSPATKFGPIPIVPSLPWTVTLSA